MTFSDRGRILVLAFAARALVLLGVMALGLSILTWAPDSWEYTGMTEAILRGEWDFYMFGLRTPGFPLLLAGFSVLFRLSIPQLVAWMPFQLALTATATVLAARLIYALTGRRHIAIAAGLLLTIDPIMLAADAPLLSEALFNPATIAAQWFCLRWLRHKRRRDFVACLVALQVMVLTRPSALFFIVIIMATIVLYDGRLWRYALLLLAGFSIPVLLWTARNYTYNHIATYSTAGIYNLLFYRDLSTDVLVTGRSPAEVAWSYAQEVETRAGHARALDERYYPVGNYDYLYVSEPARYRAMTELAIEKFLEFHVWHFVKLPWHLLQLFSKSHTMDRFLPVLVTRGVALVMLSLAAIGVLAWWQRRQPGWKSMLVLGVPFYFVATSLLLLALPETRYVSPAGASWALLVLLGAFKSKAFAVRLPRLCFA